MFQHLKMKNHGFTLSELMAVVVILAILATVGLGSFKKSVERSHFSEGLVAATTIMQAVERYYNDQALLSGSNTATSRPTLAKLDVGLENARACTTSSSYCTKTKYFEITLEKAADSSVYTKAQRMKGSTAGDYAIVVYPETFGSTMRRSTECTFSNSAGKDLCVTMGYTSCNSSKQCTK